MAKILRCSKCRKITPLVSTTSICHVCWDKTNGSDDVGYWVDRNGCLNNPRTGYNI